MAMLSLAGIVIIAIIDVGYLLSTGLTCVSAPIHASVLPAHPLDTQCVSAHSVLCRHGISSLGNLVILAAAVAYGWILAGKITLGL
jgi:hypothetical protein